MYAFLHTYLNRLPLFSRIPIILAGLLLVGFLPYVMMQDHGLDTPVSVAAFADGAFPPTETGGGGGGSGDWIAQNAFPNLTFSSPIHLLEEPGTNRLWIGEHRGRIYAIPNNENTSSKTLILNISSETHLSGESGLLSFALHPRYGIDSNYVYIFYQHKTSGELYSRVSRFTVPSIPGNIDASSELIMIQQLDKATNHNGGSIAFGNDGFLYISTGDEGGGNNSYNNGQQLNKRLFGGILRIDVDQDNSKSHAIRRQPSLHNGSDLSFTDHYFIPNDNPFLDPGGSLLEEFFALGLRNPHRMSIDPNTGNIWTGDVGQGSREEIDLIVSGGNYQWSYKEGTKNGPDSKPSNIHGTDQPPVHEFPRSSGNSVIGGYVYRGTYHSDIVGDYIFADYGSKNLWKLDNSSGASSSATKLLTLPFRPSAFGVDEAQNLYILQYSSNGKIYKLERQNPGTPSTTPTLLSQTGVFQSLSPLEPEDFAIPYELNAPFWSDGTLKRRWMIIPNNGTHNSSAEQISFSEEGEWEFPQGAVLVKHFEMPIDETDPSNTKHLETRFLIHGTDGNYYGLTYRWNDAQDDAELLTDGQADTLDITTATGTKKIVWNFPSRGECLNCHNESTKGALGPITRQLNGDAMYPVTGRTANQLKTLSFLNIFDNAPDTTQLPALLTSEDPKDVSASLEDRARAYLDVNCSSCHQPGVGIGANFDARLSTDLADQGLIYASAIDDMGISGARLILPGDPEKSILYQRVNSVHSEYAMPQLAKNLIDSLGTALLADWIMSIPVNLAGATCPPIEFNAGDVNSYGGSQDQGDANIMDSGATILVEDNGWKSIDFAYTLSPNSVLEFDFRSSIQGEEHAIGLDENDNVDDDQRRIKLYGTQSSNVILDYDTYNGSGNYQHFVIPIGSLYTGTMDRLFFIADHDASPQNGNSYFRNVTIHEGSCGTGLMGQVIDFDPIRAKDAGASDFNLIANASSGLPVLFEVVSGPASLSNNTLSLTGQSGLVEVKASQSGDASFEAAPEIIHQFWVFPAGQETGTGLTGTYFDKKNLTIEMLSRTDSVIDFYWGSGVPVAGMNHDKWAVEWKGEIESPYTETITFTTTSDDGVRLWVDNQLIIDQWNPQAAAEFSGSIALTAWQRVPIRMEYYQEDVYASARLEWSSTSLSPEVVPSAFFHPAIATGSFPVELLSFEAIPRETDVLLAWSTATELNSDIFIVERSTDGTLFQPLTQVDAAGFSNTTLEYQAPDPSPEVGENFYRLKQVDQDGTFSYSQIEQVIFQPKISLVAYPNPLGSGSFLQVDIHHFTDQMTRMEIHNQVGQSVWSQTIQQTSTQSQHQIGTEGWPPGVYVLSLIQGREVLAYQKILIH